MPVTSSEAASANSPEPRNAIAQGTLADRPIPRLLHQLFGKRFTGSFTVIDDTGDESRVYLRDGAPVHVARPNDIDRLDQVVIESGLVPAHVVSGVSTTLPPGRRLGEILIEQGLVSRASLADVLKLQIRRKLLRLFFPVRARFAVYLEPHSYGIGEEFKEVRVDPRCLIFSGLRVAYDEARLRAELAPLAGHTFRLLPSMPAALLEAMGFVANDPTVQALGGRSYSLAELPALGAKPIESLAVVLALLYTDLLEVTAPAGVSPRRATGEMPVVGLSGNTLEGVPSPFVGAVPAPRSPIAAVVAAGMPSSPLSGSPAPTGKDDAFVGQIEALFSRIDSISHFELLGIPESAPPADVNAAYLRAVRQYHPDRLASLGLRELMDKASRITSQMTEAQTVLQDPKRRAEYLAVRSGTSAPASSSSDILAAEELFQKGEGLLRKGDHARAVEAFQAAMRASPLEPSYRAHWAWARFDSPNAPKDRLVRETLKVLEDTLKERPKFPVAHYWIGLLHKHLGDAQSAESAFRNALHQDKTLLEAEREIRLIEMRRIRSSSALPTVADKPTTASAARQKEGLLNKLLKR